MPRSGTTLVEQILSSHSKVYGADEVKNYDDTIKKYFYSNEYGDHMVEYDEKLLKALKKFIESLN